MRPYACACVCPCIAEYAHWPRSSAVAQVAVPVLREAMSRQPRGMYTLTHVHTHTHNPHPIYTQHHIFTHIHSLNPLTVHRCMMRASVYHIYTFGMTPVCVTFGMTPVCVNVCVGHQISLLAIREGAADLLVALIQGSAPEIRAAAVFGLGCLVYAPGGATQDSAGVGAMMAASGVTPSPLEDRLPAEQLIANAVRQVRRTHMYTYT